MQTVRPFRYLLWILTFHPVSKIEFNAPVLLDDHLIHKRHERPRLEFHAFLLFFQHMEEYLDAPPTLGLIFFLLGNGLNFLAELCVFGEQCLVILLELVLIPFAPGRFRPPAA